MIDVCLLESDSSKILFFAELAVILTAKMSTFSNCAGGDSLTMKNRVAVGKFGSFVTGKGKLSGTERVFYLLFNF